MSAPIEGVVGDLPPALAQDHEEGPESPLQKDSSAPTYSSDDDVPAFKGRNRKQSPIHRGTEKSRERSRSPLGERTRSLSPPSNNDIRDYFMVKTKSKYNTIVTTPPPNVAPQVGHIHEPEDLAMGEPEPYSTKRSRSPGEDRPKKHQAIEGLDTDSSEEADHSASEDTSELESSQSEEEDKDQKEKKQISFHGTLHSSGQPVTSLMNTCCAQRAQHLPQREKEQVKGHIGYNVNSASAHSLHTINSYSQLLFHTLKHCYSPT